MNKVSIQFDPGNIILTANQRLAQVIRQNYQQQQGEGQLVWETPQILPFNSWLQILWHSHAFGSEQILSPAQEQQLWSQIIQATPQSLAAFLHVNSTTLLVQQAWQLLNHWQGSLENIRHETAGVPEVQLFCYWADQFITTCQQQGWLSEAVLPKRLALTLDQAHLLNIKKLMIVGFDELTPAFEALLTAIQRFVPVTEIISPSQNPHYHSQIFADLDTEITYIAHWAKQQLEKNPHARVGCVIPQLTEHRSSVTRIFNQVFVPENQLPGGSSSPLPFNISAGQSLSEFAVISTGLQVLTLDIEKIPLELLSTLLQSPYLCQNETDVNLGALLDAECRQLGKFELSFTALFTALTQWQIHYPKHTWLKRWRDFFAVSQCSDSLQSPRMWANYFTQQLNALGWPGGRKLNSLEYQILIRWQELFAELAELEIVTGPISRATALQCLQRLTAQTIFQSKSAPTTSIQILGVLESSGFDFDVLWVMGLDDRSWPPAAQPNPFLPYLLQVQQHMPHSSAQRELFYAQRITQRLLHSAPEIWVSCSSNDPDQPARFSRLISSAIAQSDLIGEFNLPLFYAEQIFNSGNREQINDQYGPSHTANLKIRGGSAILTQQAECPFRAFANFRLHATALNEPELGISAKAHGILIHNALDRLWANLKNQHNLLKLNSENLDKLLINLVNTVIHEQLAQPESPFAQIEQNRLIALLNEWLTLEKQRPPFQVIEQEAERCIELAGLTLNLKIDRIDQLDNGSQLLIDYKTGLSDIQNWLGERLQQPQLPLYALDSDHRNNFSGVAFAQLRTGELSFKGLHAEYFDTKSTYPDGMMSIASYKKAQEAPKTWTDLLTYWNRVLQKLGADFHAGYAATDPAENGRPCRTCHLQSLCRIYDQQNTQFAR